MADGKRQTAQRTRQTERGRCNKADGGRRRKRVEGRRADLWRAGREVGLGADPAELLHGDAARGRRLPRRRRRRAGDQHRRCEHGAGAQRRAAHLRRGLRAGIVRQRGETGFVSEDTAVGLRAPTGLAMGGEVIQ